MAPIGRVVAVVTADGRHGDVTVVGVGGTSYWSGDRLAFTNLETAADLAGVDGRQPVVVRADETARTSCGRPRTRRATSGRRAASRRRPPVTIPDEAHPIDADIEQVSSLIGLLGIVAGLVALVLLGSTTNTLITERTREVAVMRALGAPSRACAGGSAGWRSASPSPPS